MNVMDQLRLGG